MEAGALAKSDNKIKVSRASEHAKEEVSRKCQARQGVHRRGRHFSGRALAALGFRARSRSARSLPCIKDGQSVTVYVFPPIRGREVGKKEGTEPQAERDARSGLIARNAGARHRLETRVSPHRRNASAWQRRSGRRRAR